VVADPSNGHRYHAARAAAEAGCGKGDDAVNLDETERARLRRQALDWLRADFVIWSKRAAGDDARAREAALKALRDWQTEPALAAVREATAVDQLPEAERDGWRKLWADVASLVSAPGLK
jgi:hypothetical protein